MSGAPQPIEVLLDLTRALSFPIPLEDALCKVTEAALQLLRADHASVRLLDDTGTELLSGARAGAGADRSPLRFRASEGVAGWVVASNQPARIDDCSKDERFVVALGQGFVPRSMLAVPLYSGGKVVGVLTVSSPKGAAFDQNDELLARLLANCAVPAFEKARLERLAITDPLTHAYNRGYLSSHVERETKVTRQYETKLSMLMMDLDRFKDVNDKHGHAAGDVVLRRFADRVRGLIRKQDVLVRWGGEEFVVVMPDTDAESACSVAERIRALMEQEPVYLPSGQAVSQTVSIGIATSDGLELSTAIEDRADAAMYEAKRAGRNRVEVADAAAS